MMSSRFLSYFNAIFNPAGKMKRGIETMSLSGFAYKAVLADKVQFLFQRRLNY